MQVEPLITPLAFLILIAFAGYALLNDPWVSAKNREIGYEMVLIGIIGVFLVLMVSINQTYMLGVIGSFYD